MARPFACDDAAAQSTSARAGRRHGHRRDRWMELPREVYDQIIRKTDGVPLFVEELTKTVLELGQLHVAGDKYIAIPPLRSFAIPRRSTIH